MKNEIVLYHAHWSDYCGPAPHRSTCTQLFYKLRDAEAFMAQEEGRKGYIIADKYNGPKFTGSRLVGFFGGFDPSAQEELRIRSFLQIEWDDRPSA